MGAKHNQSSFLAQMEKTSKDIPPPASYNPKYSLIENGSFNGVGFGFGSKGMPLLKVKNPNEKQKMFLNVSESEMRMSPGPGTYAIQSNFDKIS